MSSPDSVSYQPGWGSSCQRISPVVQANSSTPAADSSLSTSISKRVRDEPYGPSSAPPTITTNSDGSRSRRSHAGGGAGLKPRGGDGNAAIVPASAVASSSAA